MYAALSVNDDSFTDRLSLFLKDPMRVYMLNESKAMSALFIRITSWGNRFLISERKMADKFLHLNLSYL